MDEELKQELRRVLPYARTYMPGPHTQCFCGGTENPCGTCVTRWLDALITRLGPDIHEAVTEEFPLQRRHRGET